MRKADWLDCYSKFSLDCVPITPQYLLTEVELAVTKLVLLLLLLLLLLNGL